MKNTTGDRTILEWFLGFAMAFALGACAGACLLGVRYLVRGNADPFDSGWPLYLQVGSFVLGLGITLLLPRPLGVALGLYGGMMAVLLAAGRAEYPVSSAIAFLVHAFVPALLGAFLGLLLRKLA